MWQCLVSFHTSVYTWINRANDHTGKLFDISKNFMDSTWCRQARVKETCIFYAWVIHFPWFFTIKNLASQEASRWHGYLPRFCNKISFLKQAWLFFCKMACKIWGAINRLKNVQVFTYKCKSKHDSEKSRQQLLEVFFSYCSS